MNVMINNLLPLALLFAAILNLSCSRGSCDQDTEVLLNAGFYSAESLENISVDSLEVFGIGIPDSSLYSMVTLKNILLPLNPSTNDCSFVVINGGRADTIDITYSRNLVFLSRECGYTYHFEINEVFFTRNDISNIIITNKSVIPGDEENIQIYF